MIAGVPDRLGRAVNNVLDNAAVFSPPGGVVEVALRDGVARGPRPRSGGARGGAGPALRPLLPRHAAARAGRLGPRAGHRATGRRGPWSDRRGRQCPWRRARGQARLRAARRDGKPSASSGCLISLATQGSGFGKNVGRTGSPIPSRLGATNERHIQHLRRSRRPQRASAGLAAAPALADARSLHARAPRCARAALPAGGRRPRRLRDRAPERRHAARVGRRRLRPVDADRVLAAPRDLPLRARGRSRSASCTGSSTACTTSTPTIPIAS